VDRLAYGDTGLEVTPLGIGLAALGRPGYVTIGHAQDLGPDRSVAGLNRRTHEVLDHAYAHGVRYLDTARSYGYGEAFLADWLATDPERASTVTVGSKWGYTYVAGWRVDAEEHEVKDHSLTTFERQYAESRKLLGAHLDLYQVHSASLATGVLDDRHLLDALTDLAGSGVVVGLSLSGPDQADTLRRALELSEAGVAPFRAVQATWNLLESSTGAALSEAQQAGWGITVKEALANGRLTARGDLPAAVVDAATGLGVTVDALAIAAALAQPWAHVVLSGATTVAHLDSNLSALEVTLPPGLVDELTAVTAESPSSYWDRRRTLAWN
jgi:aryl-alcohol dehydrogenase-like predicted oxidoreductase